MDYYSLLVGLVIGATLGGVVGAILGAMCIMSQSKIGQDPTCKSVIEYIQKNLHAGEALSMSVHIEKYTDDKGKGDGGGENTSETPPYDVVEGDEWKHN